MRKQFQQEKMLGRTIKLDKDQLRRMMKHISSEFRGLEERI